MGFDLGSAVNGAADWAVSAPLVGCVVSNPLLTALLVLAIVAVVMSAAYGECFRRAGWRRTLRAFVYLFLGVLAVLFIHHYAVRRDLGREAERRGVRDVFSGVEQSRLFGSALAVPLTYGGAAAAPAPPAAFSAAPPAPAARTAAWAEEQAAGEFSLSDVVVPGPLEAARA